MVTLFKQLPQAQIGPKFKFCCVYQIANNQTVVFSPEIGPIFFCLKANGKGLIIGYEIFEFVHSKPELRLVRKTSICITFGKNIGFEGFELIGKNCMFSFKPPRAGGF